MPTSKLEDLLARVEKATHGLDDETLGRILCAAQGVRFVSTGCCTGDDGSLEFYVMGATGPVETFARGGYRDLAPDQSIDAALALVDRKWDGMWGLQYNGAGYTGEMHDRPPFVCRAQTAPLAILGALLRALIDRQETA